MSILSISLNLESIQCSECVGVFALTERYIKDRREDGRSFHCPYCQASQCYREFENARLKRELADKEKLLEDKARLLTAAKCDTLREQHIREKVEKKLKKVNAGVCPECQRTFSDLARHIQTKHACNKDRKIASAKEKKNRERGALLPHERVKV